MIDITVGLLLLLSWFTIPLLLTHVVLGSMFAIAVAVHLATRPRLISGLLRARHRPVRRRSVRRRLAADIVLAAATIAATATGFVQWAGIAPGPANGLHSMTSGVLLVFAVRHIWVRRRALRNRFMRR